MHGPSVAWGDSLADGAARHVTMVQCAPASLGRSRARLDTADS